MRRPLIAGNWKMNTTLDEAVGLVLEMRGRLEGLLAVDRVVCPPFISLASVRDHLRGFSTEVGAQDMYHLEKGAYTGEISPVMLAGLASHVILGHSERRQFLGETDDSVNLKLKAALTHGLVPIVCVGERLEQYEAGATAEVVQAQVRGAFAELTYLGPTVIAYEPVWAIGTGKAATGPGANESIGLIRATIAALAGAEAAGRMRILYGGSVTPANIAEFVSQPEIDGALVGGASLKADDFVEIVRQTAAKRS
jgi:triosephosphate isomerase